MDSHYGQGLGACALLTVSIRRLICRAFPNWGSGLASASNYPRWLVLSGGFVLNWDECKPAKLAGLWVKSSNLELFSRGVLTLNRAKLARLCSMQNGHFGPFRLSSAHPIGDTGLDAR